MDEIKIKFCNPECKHLSITEAEQNRQKRKGPHFCNLYKAQVSHEMHHPRLVACYGCEESENA